MREELNIGPVPCDEECAQLGEDNYSERAIAECRRYVDLIRKHVGLEPPGVRLKVKGFNHDFGVYYEVVVSYDDGDENGIEYAFKCESEAPTKWR